MITLRPAELAPEVLPNSELPELGAAPSGHRHRWVLAIVIVFGAAVRAIGFTSLGLWRDDAWAVMSTRVGLGTAWHMWVTAPGFYLAERTWVFLHPGATWWAQLLPYALGVLCIPAVYWLATYFKQPVWVSLTLATATSISPVCVTYSTRIKEYQADFLVCCLVLAAGEAVRRAPGRRQLLLLGGVSVLGFFVSAAVAPVIIAVWVVVAVANRPWRPRHPIAVATTAIGCLAVAAVFYRHVPGVLRQFWAGDYLKFGSVGQFFESLYDSVLHLFALMLGAPSGVRIAGLLLLLVLAGLITLGAPPITFGTRPSISFPFRPIPPPGSPPLEPPRPCIPTLVPGSIKGKPSAFPMWSCPAISRNTARRSPTQAKAIPAPTRFR